MTPSHSVAGMDRALYLRQLRERLGSRKAVALMLGISDRQIARYEIEGKLPPNWYDLALERLWQEKLLRAKGQEQNAPAGS